MDPVTLEGALPDRRSASPAARASTPARRRHEVQNDRREHFELKETAVTIVAEERVPATAEKAIFEARARLEPFIAEDPFFQTTFEPYPVRPDMGRRGQATCACAAEKAGRGTDGRGGRGDRRAGGRGDDGGRLRSTAMVDNGGDIAMLHLPRRSTVGFTPAVDLQQILAYPGSGRPGACYGICTSSGTVGPSISFGMADAATVISERRGAGRRLRHRVWATWCWTTTTTPWARRCERIWPSTASGVDGCVVMIGRAAWAMGGRGAQSWCAARYLRNAEPGYASERLIFSKYPGLARICDRV